MLDLGRLRRTFRKKEVRAISRRYFISNGFDGTLTSTGVAVGSLLSGVSSGITVFQVGIGAAIGLATSGVWSVWEIERAEKLAELHDLEDKMLTGLEDTDLYAKKKEARAINAAMSGLGPTIGALIPMTPFLFEGVFLTMLQATLLAVALGVMLLFSFGAYMGSISKQKWFIAGARMGLAGLVVALLNVVLPG